jgi:hypothetical protein
LLDALQNLSVSRCCDADREWIAKTPPKFSKSMIYDEFTVDSSSSFYKKRLLTIRSGGVEDHNNQVETP